MALYQQASLTLARRLSKRCPTRVSVPASCPSAAPGIEFIEPTDPNGSIARFIERRGEALHHVAFQVEDIAARLAALQDAGVELIDKAPRKGAAGTIAFLHPRATRGVLIELVEKE